MNALQIDRLTKTYGSIKALDQLSLVIEEGNIFGILGPNGSGKTTTLGCILGILHQNSGTYKWFDGKFDPNPRLKIGAILETPNFYPYLNAVDNLEIVRRIKGTPKQDFMEILELVNLAERKNSKFMTYSLGMKQRLAIAATMIGDPEVVIFDEPTNGLDPEGIAEVRNTLKKIASTGKTVIMASHILDEVEKICSHVAIIKKGKLLATGTVGSILSDSLTVELASFDKEKLQAFLNNIKEIDKITLNENVYSIEIQEGFNAENLNKMAFENGINLHHFVIRKKRLEEEFLAITQNSKS